MRIHLWLFAAAGLLSVAGLFACKSTEPGTTLTPSSAASVTSSPPPPPASASAESPIPSEPAASASAPVAVASASPQDAPAERISAPLVLRLQGPDPVPSSGEFKLHLEILTRDPFQVPVVLKVSVPKGVKLASGKAEESLALPTPGTITRDYTVRVTESLGAPIVVTADTTIDGRPGLHAERKYPDPARNVPPSTTAPKPPVPRPPAPPK